MVPQDLHGLGLEPEQGWIPDHYSKAAVQVPETRVFLRFGSTGSIPPVFTTSILCDSLDHDVRGLFFTSHSIQISGESSITALQVHLVWAFGPDLVRRLEQTS
jgi:hypothetical protein